MRLSLTMVAGASSDSIADASKSWTDCGGTIGRADDCDWVLPDPSRDISRCHARIRYMNDGFYLEDASANGVFVKDRENRLKPGELHRLQDGERLFISDYQIAVQIQEDAPSVAPAATPAAPPMSSHAAAGSLLPGALDNNVNNNAGPAYAGSSGSYAQWNPLASLGGRVEPDPTPIEPPSDNPRQPYLEEHFAPPPLRPEPPAPSAANRGDAGAASGIPMDWWNQSPAPPDTAADPGAASTVPEGEGGSESVPGSDAGGEVRQPMGNILSPQPGPGELAAPAPDGSGGVVQAPLVSTDRSQQTGTDQPATPAVQPPPLADPAPRVDSTRADPPPPDPTPGGSNGRYTDALATLLAGAGINAPELTPETADEVGRILRVTVLGVMDLLRARSELKNEFRMPATLIQARENNPLKFSTNAEDALHNLLVKHNPDYLGPVAAFEAGFEDLRAHQIAMLAGMREAFMAMLERFDPETLERQFQDKGRQGAVMGRIGRRREWDQYKELFAGMRQDMDSNFHRLFGEPFIRAYEAQMARLQQSAGDRHD